jgi:hypothetical protein
MKILVAGAKGIDELPHKLDEPNLAEITDVRLPAYWWNTEINF